jgi:2-iminoacetate synthase ThiH
VLETAMARRQEAFGNAVVPMAPVEASNACASDCGFCGWRSSNIAMRRQKISEELIMEQVRYLVDKGIHYIEYVGGDDFRFVREVLPSLVNKTRALGRSLGMRLKICFCTMALTENQYRWLKQLGADAMIVWQETYDRRCYNRQIASGPKAWGIDENWKVLTGGDGYAFRLGAQERALRAGLEVALGTILGLNDNLNFEILATVRHARHLMQNYAVTPQSPLVIGMPTWNEITTPATDNRPAGRERVNPYFSYIAALYLLSLPGGRAELERRITAEFNCSAVDLPAFDRDLSVKEQFVHHYHSHDTYRERMEQAGLKLLASATL